MRSGNDSRGKNGDEGTNEDGKNSNGEDREEHDDEEKGELLLLLFGMKSVEEYLTTASDGDQADDAIRKDSVASYDV